MDVKIFRGQVLASRDDSWTNNSGTLIEQWLLDISTGEDTGKRFKISKKNSPQAFTQAQIVKEDELVQIETHKELWDGKNGDEVRWIPDVVFVITPE